MRDALGNLQRAEAFPIGNATAADTVEALGFRFAVLMAKNYGRMEYILEGYAQSIVKILRGRISAKARLGVITRDCMSWQGDFPSRIHREVCLDLLFRSNE